MTVSSITTKMGLFGVLRFIDVLNINTMQGSNEMRRWFLGSVFALLCFFPSPAFGDLINYAVGNSLTWDMLVGGSFDSITLNQANASQTSYHINCGQSLTSTFTNPASHCIAPTPLGLYPTGLGSKIDNVILQPFYGATIRQELSSIKSLVDLTRANPLNADTRFFVYATWGERTNSSGTSFLDTWNTYAPTLDSQFVPSKNTYSLLDSALRADGYNLELIGAGHAFAAVSEAINSGVVIGGISSNSDLYRDSIHASNAGRVVAAMATFAAVYKTDPSGQPITTNLFNLAGYGPGFNNAGVETTQQIVWDSYLSLTAVPEPSTTLVLASVGSLAWPLSRLRNRRKTFLAKKI